MSETPRGLRAIVLAAIVLCITISLTGARGQDKNAGLRFANVDPVRLNNDYGAMRTFREDASKRADAFDVEQRVFNSNPLLPEADQKTLLDLTLKENIVGGPPLSPSEKDTKAKLVAQSNALYDDAQRLQGTILGNVTEADKKKQDSYIKANADTKLRLDLHQKTIKSDLDQKFQEIDATYQKNLKEVLAKTAKDKNYAVIFNNQAVLYAEYDCTDDVLKALNNKK